MKKLLTVLIVMCSFSSFASTTITCSGFHKDPRNLITVSLPSSLLDTPLERYPCYSASECAQVDLKSLFNRKTSIETITYLGDEIEAQCESNDIVIFCRFKALLSTINSLPLDGEIKINVSRMAGYASIQETAVSISCKKN